MTSPSSAKSPRPFGIRIGDNEIRLGEGETLIGRDVGCEIVVDHALVSRKHARLVVEGDELYVEDLASANGTFINRTQIRGRARLREGDQLCVASCEIDVVRYGDGASPESSEEATDRPTPSSGVAMVARVALSKAFPDFVSAATQQRTPRETDASEALESAGRLADRMFALGRTDAGRKVLSEPLEELLAAARHGEALSPLVVDAAGRHAARLTQQTLEGKWMDIAIEIHLAADRPLRAATLQQFIALRAKVTGDDALLARYTERLRALAPSLDAEERLLCDRVATLIPELDD